MTKRIRQRRIELIAKQLQAVMRREAGDIIAIGELLLEAQAQLEHGEWLPWLKENFGSSVSTAENYMNAARLRKKFPAVGNLKLRPTALYLLGTVMLDDPEDDDFPYSRKAIRAILKAAETEWINAGRAHEIAMSLQPPQPPMPRPMPRPKTIEQVEAELLGDEDTSEIDDILGGSPPDLPPAPETTVRDVIVPPFDQAVGTLAQLQTKPLANFVTTTHETHKIRAVTIFLREVADAIEQHKATAQPQEQDQ